MEKIQFLLFILAIMLLSFIGGSLVTFGQIFPYGYLHQAYLGGKAWVAKTTQPQSAYQTDLWTRAHTRKTGVTIFDPGKANKGFTLYTSAHEQAAFLIDMRGHVLHKWQLPFRRFWNRDAAVKSPQPASHIFITRAYLYPNGDLLANYIGVGDTPWGLGLVKMDKDSKVIWKYLDERTHHEVTVGDDGRIYVLTHSVHLNDIPGFPQLAAPRIDDFVTILSPDGQLLKRISILGALLNSLYARLLITLPFYTAHGAGDYLHTNTIHVVEAEAARHFPFAEAGDILLSFRELSTIAVLDVANKAIRWARRGSWIAQHDPHILPDGDILLFDNQGHFGPGGTSRVIEFNPRTNQIDWRYTGDNTHYFQSLIRSGTRILSNGNILITESDAGRLLEVTPDKEIVWEFTNPVRGGQNGEFMPVLSVARRISPEALDPSFLDSLER